MSWVNISNQTSNTGSINQTTSSSTGKNTLGKDDFLKILTIQLSNQDPANPLQDKDFVAQMAQFSTLEQMTNMNKTLEQMSQAQFASVIGKNVTWQDSTTLAVSTGVVSGVSTQAGKNYYVIDDQKVPVEQVTDIK
jgi:flagellar basal-body rod modification protein FlgD